MGKRKIENYKNSIVTFFYSLLFFWLQYHHQHKTTQERCSSFPFFRKDKKDKKKLIKCHAQQNWQLLMPKHSLEFQFFLSFSFIECHLGRCWKCGLDALWLCKTTSSLKTFLSIILYSPIISLLKLFVQISLCKSRNYSIFDWVDILYNMF